MNSEWSFPVHNTALTTNHCYAQITCGSGFNDLALFICNDGTTWPFPFPYGYVLFTSGGTAWEIRQMTAGGANTTVATGSATGTSSGAVCRIEHDGAGHISAYRNGALVCQGDATIVFTDKRAGFGCIAGTQSGPPTTSRRATCEHEVMTVVDLPTGVLIPQVAIALADLGDCVCAELAATGAGETCWCGLYPGAGPPAWEGCGDCGNDVCGMAWVRLDQSYPSETFPVPIVQVQCQLPLAYRIEIGVVRCMPTMPDGSGATPTMLAEVVLGQMVDAAAIHRAMLCCENVRVAPETYVPRGPLGGCVGGAWTAYLEIR